MEKPPENDCCSVCHDNFTLPCQANCSHWFCGSCILRVWHHGSALGPCKCPICRRLINLLIPSEESLRHRSEPEAGEVLGNLERYNRLFGGGANPLIQRLRDLPFFLRRLSRELTDPQRSLPLVFRARMIFAMLLSGIYILSPIDIIPEGILGIVGILDDLLIALIFFLHIAAIYRSTLLSRHGGMNMWELVRESTLGWDEMLLLLLSKVQIWVLVTKRTGWLQSNLPNWNRIKVVVKYGLEVAC